MKKIVLSLVVLAGAILAYPAQVLAVFSPSDVGGLSVWLKADDIAVSDGVAIQNWPNQGTLGGAFVTNPAGVHTRLSLQENELNGHDVAAFTGNTGGAGSTYMDFNGSAPTSGTFTVYGVFANTNGANPITTIDTLVSSKDAGGGTNGWSIATSNNYISTTQRQLLTEGNGMTATVYKNNGVANTGLNLAQNEYAITRFSFANVAPRTALRLFGFTDISSPDTQNNLAELLIFSSDLSQVEHDNVINYLQQKYNITITPTTTTASYTALTSRNERLKGAMYWPRVATSMNWWPKYLDGTITDAQITADLQHIKNELGANTVRVFLYYDLGQRTLGVPDFTDGAGTINSAMVDKVSHFIDLADAQDLDVLPNLFMELEWSDPNLVGTGTTLVDNYAHHLAYLDTYSELFASKTNVPALILLNEPDGYGAWSNQTRAVNLLTWLNNLKTSVDANPVTQDLRVYITSSTHDNQFAVIAGGPSGADSIYKISDAAVFNSFLWEDDGGWEYAVPPLTFNYVNTQNTLQKPVILSEFGWPTHYDESGIVIANSIWNKPLGSKPLVPSTPEIQRRAYQEVTYWAEKKALDGVMAWSAFDHAGAGAYRDPFGLIDETGTAKPAAAIFKRMFTTSSASTGELPWSLLDGTATGTNAKVNGINGFTSVPAGVTLPDGTSYTSASLPYKLPLTATFTYEIGTVPASGGPIYGVQFVSGGSTPVLQVRRDETNRAWQLWLNGEQVAATQNNTDAGMTTDDQTLALDMSGTTLAIRANGTALSWFVYTGGSLTATPYTYTLGSSHFKADIKLTAGVASTSMNILSAKLTDEASKPYISSLSEDKYSIFHRILSLLSGYKPVLSDTLSTDLSQTHERGDEVVRISTTADAPIAEITTSFTADRDWSSLIAGHSSNQAVLHYPGGISQLPGASDTFTLFVPKGADDDRVVICPNAQSLADISFSCPSASVRTTADSGVSVVTVGSGTYWKIENLTGTGGQSGRSGVASSTSTSTSSSSDTTSSAPTCSDVKVSGSPDLFQIDATATTAKLFFTPLNQTNQYYISFSTSPDAQLHGTSAVLAPEGVQNFTVAYLQPSTTYYFKVRGQYGCMPGDWSSIFSITTRATNMKAPISYYKNAPPRLASSFSRSTFQAPAVLSASTTLPRPLPSLAGDVTAQPDSTSEPVTVTSPVQSAVTNVLPDRTSDSTASAPAKKCFLWWCW